MYDGEGRNKHEHVHVRVIRGWTPRVLGKMEITLVILDMIIRGRRKGEESDCMSVYSDVLLTMTSR